jgi:DNA-binding CsgD family transcriptional regulator
MQMKKKMTPTRRQKKSRRESRESIVARVRCAEVSIDEVWLRLFKRLTCQESFVAALLYQSMPYKLVADFMGISERTVRFHIAGIGQKTGCRTPVQIALLVQRANSGTLSQVPASVKLWELQNCISQIKK